MRETPYALSRRKALAASRQPSNQTRVFQQWQVVRTSAHCTCDRGRFRLRRTWIATDLDRQKEQQDHEAQIKPRSPHGAELHDPVKYCVGQTFSIDILRVIAPPMGRKGYRSPDALGTSPDRVGLNHFLRLPYGTFDATIE